MDTDRDDRPPWQLAPHEYARRPEATRVPAGSILALKPRDLTREEMARHQVEDLRALAQVVRVPHTGTRAQLVERIGTALDARRFLADATASQLRQLRSSYLGGWLRALGQYVPSNRYARAAALIGWRDRCRTEGTAALARANHYRIVRRAVRAGLPVPAEVLEHYPDLTPEGDPRPLFDRQDAAP